MIRTLNVVLAFSCVAMLIGVYALKFSVEETASRRVELSRKIERQEGQLSLLKADWAYLNQPTHIRPIVMRHLDTLGLQTIGPRQIGSFAALPMRPPKPDTAGLDALFESLDAGIDPADAPLGDLD